jgi:hypothetical protein
LAASPADSQPENPLQVVAAALPQPAVNHGCAMIPMTNCRVRPPRPARVLHCTGRVPMPQIKPISLPNEIESQGRAMLNQWLSSTLIPQEELLDNLGLFVRRQSWARFAFMMEVYKRILPVHGVIIEFGTRWGQNMALFTAFRGLFEPFNYNRKVIGFDTFAGFPAVHPKDGRDHAIVAGNYTVSAGYEQRLHEVLLAHEYQAPLHHINKHEIIKGDITKTFDEFLQNHPELIVALAYFDMDLYEPTRHCLERILPVMPRGSVLAFDELNYDRLPGETQALRELVDLRHLRLERLPFSPLTSFAVLE